MMLWRPWEKVAWGVWSKWLRQRWWQGQCGTTENWLDTMEVTALIKARSGGVMGMTGCWQRTQERKQGAMGSYRKLGEMGWRLREMKGWGESLLSRETECVHAPMGVLRHSLPPKGIECRLVLPPASPPQKAVSWFFQTLGPESPSPPCCLSLPHTPRSPLCGIHHLCLQSICRIWLLSTTTTLLPWYSPDTSHHDDRLRPGCLLLLKTLRSCHFSPQNLQTPSRQRAKGDIGDDLWDHVWREPFPRSPLTLTTSASHRPCYMHMPSTLLPQDRLHVLHFLARTLFPYVSISPPPSLLHASATMPPFQDACQEHPL